MATKAPASRARFASRGAVSSGSVGGKSNGRPVATICQYSPALRRHGVNFRADQRGETVAAQPARVGNRPIESAQEMIGHLEEVIARTLIRLDDLRGVQGSVGKVRMGVKIPAPETARRREGTDPHRIRLSAPAQAVN